MKRPLLILSILLILIILLITILLRGDFISEKVRAYATTELEHATGHRVRIEKAVFNLFPTYIELKGTEVFDKDGRPIIRIKKARGFFGLGRLFHKELRVKVKATEPYLNIERYKDGTYNLSPLILSLKGYLKEERKGLVKLDFKGVSADNGDIDFIDKDYPFAVHGKGISIDLAAPLISEGFRVYANVSELKLRLRSFPALLLKAETRLKGKEGFLKIDELRISNLDSSVDIEGGLNLSERPAIDIKTRIILMAESFREFLGLKGRPEGEIYISGNIKGDIPDLEARGPQRGPQVFPYLDLHVKMELPVGLLKRIFKREDGIEGILSLKGDIRGRYPELLSKGRFSFSEGEIYGVDVKKIESEFDYQSRRLRFSDIRGDVMDGVLEGGLLALKTEAGGIEGIEGNGSVRYTKKGGSRAKGLTPSITGVPKKSSTFWGALINRAEVIFSSKKGILMIESGTISTSLSSAEFSGSLSLKTLKMSLPFNAHTEEIAEWIDPYYPGVKGRMDIRGTIEGHLTSPVVEGISEIRDGLVKGVPIQRGWGNVGYKDREVSVSGFRISQEGSSYIVDGKVRFGPEGTFYDAKAKLRNSNPRRIISIFYKDLPIETSLDGEMRFKGGGRDYEGEAIVTLGEGNAYGQDFDRARIRAILKRDRYSQGEIIFPSIQIEKGSNTLYAYGRIGLDGSFDGRVSSKRIELGNIYLLNGGRPNPSNRKEGIKGVRGMVGGVASIMITGKGRFENPEAIANIGLKGISYKGGLLGDGVVDISLKEKRLRTSARIGGLRLDGIMVLRDGLPWDAVILMKDVRLDDLPIQGGAIPTPTNSGKVSIITTGSIKAEGKGIDTERLFMTIRLSSIALNILGYKVYNDGDAEIYLKGGDLDLHSLKFKGPEGSSIEVGGDLRLKVFYNLYLYGKADIGILRPFIPNLESLNGDGEFMVALSGRWEDPRIEGMVNFKDGSLKIKDFPQRIRRLSGKLTFEKERLVLDSLDGEVGGGKLDLSGFATLKGISLRDFYLQGNLQNVRYRYIEGLIATFDGTLIYEGDMNAQRLSGEVIFKKALYSRRIDWKSWLLELREMEEKPRPEVSTVKNTDLNIHISGNIHVDNNIGKGPVSLDLVVKGKPIRPILFGRIESREGQIFFRKNSFRIISATADFFDPNRIYPVFNIVADTELKGYRIHLSLNGPVDRFSLTLTSDPPLSEADLLALLTVGQPSKGLQGLEAGVGASEAASFITGRLQDVLEERLRDIAGLDRFQVDPYVTRSSVAGGPRLTVGKGLLNGRLYMTYSANIGTSEEQVIRVEYKLGKNVSLIGVRDEQGQVGGDLKFRFEFR